MAQHDMTVDNADGATVRADINSALQALVGLNAGNSAPGTTFANMLWADLTNGLLKRRNQANSAWKNAGPLATTLVVAQATTYSIALSDYGVTYKASGTWTLSLLAAATAGDDFKFYVRNTGSGLITVDPDGSEQIDGASTLTLYPNDACAIVCDGSNWYSIGLGSLGKQTVVIPATAMLAPSSNAATSVTSYGASSLYLPIKGLAFSNSTQQLAQFDIPMPKGADPNRLPTYQPIWTGPVGSGGVVWSVRGAAVRDAVAYDTTPGSAQNVTDTYQSSLQVHFAPESSNVQVSNTPQAGDLYRFTIERAVNDASDTYNQPATLLAVKVYYYANARNDL